MKRLIFFLIPLILFSACSDFYHLRYKKLNKIPAQGYVAPREIKPRELSARKKISMNVPAALKKNVIDSEKQIPAQIPIEKKTNRNHFTPQKAEEKTNRDLQEKTKMLPQIKKHPRKFDGAGLLVILILLFCLGLVIGGSIVFIIGIYVGFWVPILVGLLMFLLGIFPIIGFIGFMVGDRYRPVENYEDKEKKIN